MSNLFSLAWDNFQRSVNSILLKIFQQDSCCTLKALEYEENKFNKPEDIDLNLADIYSLNSVNTASILPRGAAIWTPFTSSLTLW